MANPAKVILKIVSVKGVCGAGHKEGEEFGLSKDFVVGRGAPGCLCDAAFNAMYPAWRVLRSEGEYPWEKDRDQAHVACPDPFNPVIMQLRRVRD